MTHNIMVNMIKLNILRWKNVLSNKIYIEALFALYMSFLKINLYTYTY